MPNHLTPDERARLSELEAALASLGEQAEPLKRERDTIRNRARQRKHCAKSR